MDKTKHVIPFRILILGRMSATFLSPARTDWQKLRVSSSVEVLLLHCANKRWSAILYTAIGIFTLL